MRGTSRHILTTHRKWQGPQKKSLIRRCHSLKQHVQLTATNTILSPHRIMTGSSEDWVKFEVQWKWRQISKPPSHCLSLGYMLFVLQMYGYNAGAVWQVWWCRSCHSLKSWQQPTATCTRDQNLIFTALNARYMTVLCGAGQNQVSVNFTLIMELLCNPR